MRIIPRAASIALGVAAALTAGFGGGAAMAAGAPAPAALPISPANRPSWSEAAGAWGAMTRTISGVPLRAGAAASTKWINYPDACFILRDIPISYAKKTTPTIDSTTTYDPGTIGPYGCPSTVSKYWKWVDTALLPADQIPPPMSGTKLIWMGEYNTKYLGTDLVGYPNSSDYQILYVDTGSHGANYTLNVKMKLSCQKGDAASGDGLFLLGGGGGEKDPLGNDRTKIGTLISGGTSGNSRLLATFTGTITAVTNPINVTSTPVRIEGTGTAAPATVSAQLTVSALDRALYFVFRSDGSVSTQDGSWLYGDGVTLDDLGVTGAADLIFDEDSYAGVTDAYGGTVILGTSLDPILSARVPPSDSKCFYAALGSSAPTTSDYCSPGKSLSSDRFFEAADSTTELTPPALRAGISTCAFPLTMGTGRLMTTWTQFMDLPRGSGLIQTIEYQFYRGGEWSAWHPASPSRASRIEGGAAWSEQVEELPLAALADSVRVKYGLECATWLTGGASTCAPVSIGLLYDNLGLVEVSGIPAEPAFAIFTGDVLQTTFVSGTMTGVNCTVAPCWPGIRGSDLSGSPNPSIAASAINDNVNSAVGDSMVVRLQSALRPGGMGINWHVGFDKGVAFGKTIAHTNASYQASLGAPRAIYRLFDPSTKTWSPFDSTELDADHVSVSATDTVAVGDAFRFDWPPRDKIGLNLPGGFTINGVAAYASLSFLPKGARLQYYFKLVDVSGAVRYQFQSDAAAHETEDLPSLPGSAVRAPDILECDILPRIYPVGAPGTLLAGRAATPVLHVDAGYGAWSYGLDPMTQALRGLGVRADRYRVLPTIDLGNNVGGRPAGYSPFATFGNFFPTQFDYGIKDSLAVWYRIVLVSSHDATFSRISEADALLLQLWWKSPTGGGNDGDRCLFATGDNLFEGLLSPRLGSPGANQVVLAQDVFGVATVAASWTGTGSTTLPTIDDRFLGGGPGLGAPLSVTYPADGECLSGPRRFDALTPIGAAGVASAAFFPGAAQAAAVLRMNELDIMTDKDRSKSIGYGYSIQFVRKAGISPSSPLFAHSGAFERMQILYKALTGCRGARTGAAVDTGKCWPCPADANMTGNWAALSGFMTGTFGPLYPIQDPATATAVEISASTPAAPQWLAQNRPNPFNPSTEIPFANAAEGRITLSIFDVQGRLVIRLLDRTMPAGIHAVRWDGRARTGTRSASGVYFYRIRFPDGSAECRKLTLLQ